MKAETLKNPSYLLGVIDETRKARENGSRKGKLRTPSCYKKRLVNTLDPQINICSPQLASVLYTFMHVLFLIIANSLFLLPGLTELVSDDGWVSCGGKSLTGNSLFLICIFKFGCGLDICAGLSTITIEIGKGSCSFSAWDLRLFICWLS